MWTMSAKFTVFTGLTDRLEKLRLANGPSEYRNSNFGSPGRFLECTVWLGCLRPLKKALFEFHLSCLEAKDQWRTSLVCYFGIAGPFGSDLR